MTWNMNLAANLPTTSDRLYDMYLDAKAHASITGATVNIEPRAGSAFSAFDGMLSGKLLHIEPKTLIVQTWRSGNWPKDAIDSILTMTFCPHKESGCIELVQINVADEDFAGVSHGWEKY